MSIANSSTTDSELVKKWSSMIMEDGFTAIPNLLIDHMVDLSITPLEMSILVAIERHRFFKGTAWPSNQRIADLTGYSTRSISRATNELEDRDLIKKIYREGRSCLYDFSPLVRNLEMFKPY